MNGRFFDESPQLMSHFSQGTPEHFSAHAVYVDHRLRPQVADSGLEPHPAIRLDDQNSIEAGGTADITTERHADATHFCTDAFRLARNSLAPFELLLRPGRGRP